MTPYYIHSVTAGGTIDYDAMPYQSLKAALSQCGVYLKYGSTFIHVVQWINGRYQVAADFDAVKRFNQPPQTGN